MEFHSWEKKSLCYIFGMLTFAPAVISQQGIKCRIMIWCRVRDLVKGWVRD